LASQAINLIGELRYIQVFYLFDCEEAFGERDFCLKNFEIALEYLKNIKLENEVAQDEDEFELQ
jgi:hypothetical protein